MAFICQWHWCNTEDMALSMAHPQPVGSAPHFDSHPVFGVIEFWPIRPFLERTVHR